MRKYQIIWISLILSVSLITSIACLSLTPLQKALSPTSTPTQTPSVLLNIGGGGGNGTGGSGGNGSGGGNGQGGSGGNNNGASTPAPTPDPTPSPQGPYVVKQIVTLGDETIAGEVCSTAVAFGVNVTTPKITFTISFAPETVEGGKWSESYSFPSLGETHDANGSYTLSPAGPDGTLLLTMKGSDHVVFNGFDGNLPLNYQFDLVPSSQTSCPNS